MSLLLSLIGSAPAVDTYVPPKQQQPAAVWYATPALPVLPVRIVLDGRDLFVPTPRPTPPAEWWAPSQLVLQRRPSGIFAPVADGFVPTGSKQSLLALASWVTPVRPQLKGPIDTTPGTPVVSTFYVIIIDD